MKNGDYPIIFKTNDYPQIICISSNRDKHLVAVCGIATQDILNKFQTDELVKSENLLKRGTKTCFYGFEHLIFLKDKNVSDIIKIFEKYGRK